MEFREWWDTVGSGIRPAIISDMEAHAHFVANAAWNAAQQKNKVAEQTPTNSKSMPCCSKCGKSDRITWLWSCTRCEVDEA